MSKRSITSIAILGGGFFGVGAATKLLKLGDDQVKVTLFTLNHFITMMPATVRAVTGDFTSADVCRNYEDILDKRIDLKVVEQISEFDEHSVTFVMENESAEKAQTMQFDFIVIATGMKWNHPLDYSNLEFKTKEGFDKYSAQYAESLRAAKKIVLVGAGEVGIELAGEIAYDSMKNKGDKKQIILVHSRSQLLDDAHVEKNRRSVQVHLENMGVEFIFNVRGDLENSTATSLKLSNGDSIDDIDCLLNLTGPKANVPPTKLDLGNARGFVKVNDSMQTVKYGNVFAIGDVNDLAYKSISTRATSIDLVYQNISKLIHNREAKDLKKMSKRLSERDIMKNCSGGLSIGPTAGVGQFYIPYWGLCSVPEFLVVKKKSTKLHVDHWRVVVDV